MLKKRLYLKFEELWTSICLIILYYIIRQFQNHVLAKISKLRVIFRILRLKLYIVKIPLNYLSSIFHIWKIEYSNTSTNLILYFVYRIGVFRLTITRQL